MIDRITASGKFSSPYGVSFILTSLKFKYSTISYSSFRLLTEYHSFLQKILNVSNHTLGLEFPSPYGVSFILTQQYRLKRIVYHSISVSLWRIIHSYLNCNIYILNKKVVNISVSLWSIIHSYLFLV